MSSISHLEYRQRVLSKELANLIKNAKFNLRTIFSKARRDKKEAIRQKINEKQLELHNIRSKLRAKLNSRNKNRIMRGNTRVLKAKDPNLKIVNRQARINLNMLNAAPAPTTINSKEPNTNTKNSKGGSKKKKTKRKTNKKKTRKPKVHTGPRGGKYIMRKGKKVYV